MLEVAIPGKTIVCPQTPEEEIRAIARSIGLKEYQRAGELLNQLVDRNATLAAQVAAAKEVVRNDLELLGTRATRILALEEMMGRCLAAWQNSPSWDNRELLAEAQALLN